MTCKDHYAALGLTIDAHLFEPDESRDLYFDLALTPWEAALGTDLNVDTLDGPVRLSVPAGTRAGGKLCLPGHGLAMDPVGHSPRGDLFAVVHIDVPPRLSVHEQALFSELAATSTFNPRHSAERSPQSKPQGSRKHTAPTRHTEKVS
jgi:curved DNA-binding protein